MAEIEPAGLVESVKTGDKLRSLIAMRDHLAELLSIAAPKDGAALTKQLAAIIEQIEAAGPSKGATPLDELKARRSARGATSSVRAGTSRKRQRR